MDPAVGYNIALFAHIAGVLASDRPAQVQSDRVRLDALLVRLQFRLAPIPANGSRAVRRSAPGGDRRRSPAIFWG
jgi:hypothetical protein